MNLNMLATAAFLVLAASQVVQAYVALQPSAEDVHFAVVQEYCKKEAQQRGDGERAYIECMAQGTGERR